MTTAARSRLRPSVCHTQRQPRCARRSCSAWRSACAKVARRLARSPKPSHEASVLVQRTDVGEFRQRYRWLMLVTILAFGTLIGRLAQLQIVEGDLHRAQARRNIVRERSLATTRGVIRDAF